VTDRRSDRDVHDAVTAAAPGALGGLLDLLVQVLGVLPTVYVPTLPRMADFARVLAALDAVAGWDTLNAYLADAGTLAGTVIDADPFPALRGFIDQQQQ
jgi:hypothetical protein